MPNKNILKQIWVIILIIILVVFGFIFYYLKSHTQEITPVLPSTSTSNVATSVQQNQSNDFLLTTSSINKNNVVTKPAVISPLASVESKAIFDFEFSPVFGQLPLSFQSGCYIKANEKFNEISIHRGSYKSLQTGESPYDRFISISDTSNSELGPVDSEGYQQKPSLVGTGGTLGTWPVGDDSSSMTPYLSKNWFGSQKVYCSVRFDNGKVVSSEPIEINFTK